MNANDWNSTPISKKIYLYRIHSTMNLGELASKSGISPSHLSKIENRKSVPSVDILDRIAKALNTSVVNILTISPFSQSSEVTGTNRSNHEEKIQPLLVRKHERLKLHPPNSDLYYELLTPDLQRKLQVTLVNHPPKHKCPTFTHKGEECMICISGQVRAVVGEKEFILNAGDSVSFDSSLTHQVCNDSSEEAVIISANTPATF